jgi:hypothetical protein
MTDPLPTTGIAASWLDRGTYPDLPAEAERELRAAALCWHREAEAELHLTRARELAGGHIAVLIAHYRYHLHRHELLAAREAAERCLHAAAERVGLPLKFREVTAAHANFASGDPDLRSWLFTLQAYGYVSLRSGFTAEGRRALEQLVALDSTDQTKTRLLLKVIEMVGASQD